MMRARLAWDVLKETVTEFMEDKVLRLSAALAYYAIFSLGPLLVIVIGIASFFLGQATVQDEVQRQLQAFVGSDAAQAVQSLASSKKHGTGIVATALGIVALVIGATGLFGQLQDSLNTIWEVQPKPGRGLWGLLRDRFLSFTMILGIAFLLLISMVITTLLQAATGALGDALPMSETALHALNFVVSFSVITLLFAMIFKYLPDAQVRWRDVWVGAAGTAILFTIGKFAIGLYLGQQSTASTYGAAGSLVLVLLWVYYSSLILFFGAEFTQVYARQTGSRIAPSTNAVRVTDSERAQQGLPRREGKQAGPPGASAGSAPVPDSHPGPAVWAYRDGPEQAPRRMFASAVTAAFISGWLVHRKFTKPKQSKSVRA
jgi:membrane protein